MRTAATVAIPSVNRSEASSIGASESLEILLLSVLTDDSVLARLPNLTQMLVSAGVPSDHDVLQGLLAVVEDVSRAHHVSEAAAVAVATMLGDVAAWGLNEDEVLVLVAPLGTTLHVTVPSAVALAVGFSLGPFSVPALGTSVLGLSVQTISWATNVYAPHAVKLSNSMVCFLARIHGQSVELTNLVRPLLFTVSMTELLLVPAEAGLVSERACVYWNTTAAAWSEDVFGMCPVWSLGFRVVLWGFPESCLVRGCGKSAFHPTRTRVATRH